MGFMDAILGSPEESSSVQGYGALPKGQRQFVMDTVRGAEQFVSPYTLNPVTGQREINQANIDRFTPLAQTADETEAIERMRQGFAPTPESLQADLSMLMNPFDQYVIDEINRQALGENSILQQNMTNAGQLGSNRQMFGAGEIESNRLQQVGLFKQDQYNTALDQALGRLTDLRMTDTQNLMGIGDFQRQLDYQTKQAPVTALQTAAGLQQQLGISGAIAGTGTSKSTGASSGLLGTAADMAAGFITSGAGPAMGMTGGFDPTTGITWNSGRA